MDYIHNFLKEKGNILVDFVDLEKTEENDVVKMLNETKRKYLEQESEVNHWMNQKAEPNLMEVERKSIKYKLKWESLKIFEKK